MVKRYLDVNVLVYYLLDDKELGDRAEYWINNTDEIYTSEITFFQLIIILKNLTKEDEKEILRKLSEVFEGLNVKFVHLEPYELKEVYEIASKNNLDFEDAIHYYCSRKINAEMISNDSDLKKFGAKF
ncbi:type II toxin-antitoxin system VapC family toxin [Sulfurisphaera ohwakuensis]|uniref:PIN domain-containing protein n=1 Tax=Sulfurisphaera ohwakuensis TaxID=69656 RepID=A0A650CG10_SULOH|nr:PIN domain-containing protein [Sulfurisphaera ohwakuensis]MBB5255254.1 putative nucleic acid-binding protein [Sulfurisphaera ohwakuensis]QGR16477.1 PIN domain-containing protein [Sulfurisphaera ohwakuensis]